MKLVPFIPRPTEQTDPLIPLNELAMAEEAERRLEASEHATFEPIHSTTKDINMVVRRQ